MKFACTVLSTLFLLSSIGCNKTADDATSNQPKFAVVYAEKLTKELGDDNRITEMVQKISAQATKDVNDIQQTLQLQIDAKRKEYGDKPTEAQQRELALLIQNSKTTLRNNQLKAQQDYTTKRNNLINELRAEYKEITKKIAKAKNLDIVMYADTGPDMVFASEKVDITSDVLAAIRDARAASRNTITPPAPQPKPANSTTAPTPDTNKPADK